MELLRNILFIAAGLAVVLAVSIMPGKIFRIVGKVFGNAVIGLLVLLLINLCAGWTDFSLPLNGLTVAVSGVLGAPGVVALAALAAI